MNEPLTRSPPGNAPVVIRIMLAVFCLLPLAIGLLVIGAVPPFLHWWNARDG